MKNSDWSNKIVRYTKAPKLYFSGLPEDKSGYISIKPEDLVGNYESTINLDGTVTLKEDFVEYNGRKYWCRKIDDNNWTFIEIDSFPPGATIKDFKSLK